jgi:hypothetical protein
MLAGDASLPEPPYHTSLIALINTRDSVITTLTHPVVSPNSRDLHTPHSSPIKRQ